MEWTTEEALQKLFPPAVRKHLKRAVKEATEKAEKSTKPKDTP
jgi:pyrroline-5-carboxylate reductase